MVYYWATGKECSGGRQVSATRVPSNNFHRKVDDNEVARLCGAVPQVKWRDSRPTRGYPCKDTFYYYTHGPFIIIHQIKKENEKKKKEIAWNCWLASTTGGHRVSNNGA